MASQNGEQDPVALASLVSAHLDTLCAGVQLHPFVDLPLVEVLRERIGTILSRWDEWDDVQRAAVRDVVEYVVDSDDEEHDLRSPIGLVDDEERLAELERFLGLRHG
ncbi:MAG: hypothetical protein U0Q15_06860 [Kineosporiaceae bacterium]